MGLETVTHISDLNASNPATGDDIAQGDDHIRNIKTALLTDLPNIDGVVNFTPAEANALAGVTAGTTAASKAVVLDASSKIDTLDMTAFKVGGASVTSTAAELNYNDVSAAGAAEASKAVILNGSKDISGINSLGIEDNLVISTNGKGIDFSATADAGGSASELLDDYEEGTWTPVLSDGSNNATSSVAVGFYTKIGRLVHVKARLTTSSLGSVSGNLRVTGLPYASASDADSHGTCAFGQGNSLSITASENLSGFVPPNTAYITLQIWGAATGVANLQETHWTANGDGIFEATYYV
jgi:hypothetical protein